MDDGDLKTLKIRGWTVECESPFEMRHDDGSFQTGPAAEAMANEMLGRGSTVSDIKYSKAPWSDGAIYIRDANGDVIAMIVTGSMRGAITAEQMAANGRLLAAAPKLLEFAKKAQQDEKWKEEATALIREAEYEH